MPAQIRDKLEAIRARFFWGGDTEGSKMHWIKWSSVLASKEKGGLGFGSLQSLNLSLLLKWYWRFLTCPDALWVNVINNIYNHPYTASWYKFKSSSVWGSICGVMANLIKDKLPPTVIQRRIGNGLSTRFWHDNWVGNDSLAAAFPRLYTLDLNRDCYIAERWDGHQENWNWRRDVRDGAESDQLRLLTDILKGITLCSKSDSWCWSLDNKNVFSVNGVRKFLDRRFLPNATHSTRWNPFVPAKVNIFVWRLLLDRLPTRINLCSRGIDIPTIFCPLCERDFESSHHVMVDCDIAKKVWHSISKWLDIDIPTHTDPLMMLQNVDSMPTNIKGKRLIETVLDTAWWCIWRFRNDTIFNPTKKRDLVLLDSIIMYSFLWYSSRYRLCSIKWVEWLKNHLLHM